MDLGERIRSVMALDPAADAVEFEGTWRSWGELAAQVAEIEGLLDRAALGEGSVVGVLLRNRPEQLGAVVALLVSGRCLLVLNPIQGATRLAGELRQLRPAALLAHGDDWKIPGVREAAQAVGSLGIELLAEPQLGARAIAGLDAPGPGPHHPDLPGVAVQMLTSGTTGPPKRVPLRFDEMAACLEQREPGDLVLIHGCCHNPCGADLSPEHWDVVLELAQRRGFTPFIDLAYQGFGNGLDEDARGVRLLAANLPELVVASSCSKNFGLYRERTGAIMLISRDSERADAAKSQLLSVIRGIYSMPPAHGGAIVDNILSDPALTKQWTDELAVMRDRINGLRALLVERFRGKGAGGRFDFIERQRGMFSFLGISPEQIDVLREQHGIYIVGSSRINVAGASRANVDALVDAVLSVL